MLRITIAIWSPCQERGATQSASARIHTDKSPRRRASSSSPNLLPGKSASVFQQVAAPVPLFQQFFPRNRRLRATLFPLPTSAIGHLSEGFRIRSFQSTGCCSSPQSYDRANGLRHRHSGVISARISPIAGPYTPFHRPRPVRRRNLFALVHPARPFLASSPLFARVVVRCKFIAASCPDVFQSYALVAWHALSPASLHFTAPILLLPNPSLPNWSGSCFSLPLHRVSTTCDDFRRANTPLRRFHRNQSVASITNDILVSTFAGSHRIIVRSQSDNGALWHAMRAE